MRKTMHALFLAAGLCWGAAATAAVAVELAGVKVEDSVTVSGTKLQLNGAGIRYKARSRCTWATSTRRAGCLRWTI